MLAPTRRIALLVFPNLSLMGYALALEMLRFANGIAGRAIYESVVVAETEGEIRCSNGTRILPGTHLDQIDDVDMVLICSSIRYRDNPDSPAIRRWLKTRYRSGAALGALGSGVWVLAEAGLLDHRHCAVHWTEIDAFRERYPLIKVTPDHYSVDGRFFTSVGGDSVTDMMLSIIARHHGELVAEQVRGMILIKPESFDIEQQNLLARSLNGKSARRVQRVLLTMENNVESPLPIPRLCVRAGINSRTLVRHTQEAFGCSPKALYIRVRLERAKTLLAHSANGITDIALSCGFRSLAHFSTQFKQYTGDSPSRWRSLRKYRLEGQVD